MSLHRFHVTVQQDGVTGSGVSYDHNDAVFAAAVNLWSNIIETCPAGDERVIPSITSFRNGGDVVDFMTAWNDDLRLDKEERGYYIIERTWSQLIVDRQGINKWNKLRTDLLLGR